MGFAMTAYASEEEDAPLDPAAERLRRKLVRLLLVSGGIMVLGLIAVFSAIVYKVNGAGAERTGLGARLAGPVSAPIPIPPGTRLVSTALDGDWALLHLEAADGSAALILVDLASGATIGSYPLTPD